MKIVSSALICVATVLAVSAPLDATAQRTFLRTGEFLRNHEMLFAENGGFYAVLESNGNFAVYKGSSPHENRGLLWQSGPHENGQYFASQQPDGNFAIYRGTGPADNKGHVWSHQQAPGQGLYFLALQPDGNLCTYRGTTPAYNSGRVWCSGATAPTSWFGPGQLIVSAGGNLAGSRMFFGPATAGGPVGTWLKKDVDQRWVFLADTTLRVSLDRGKCLRAWSINGAIETGKCDGSPDTMGWSYNASDKTLRKATAPGGCVRADSIGGESRRPHLDAQCHLKADPKDNYSESSKWTVQQ